ncbi:hypothetical protein [Pedobacter helvus]|uniref:DUF481 domain-containing protein n=1 Tax=Pedobacter helvus TaxID=2563444 RepID=A0ABW9JBV8_9SPHI|nr:hypothetical protein [Pedobacter ureilyticus]
MKRTLYLSFIFFSFILSSCTRYLFPATAGNDAVYKPKPMVADSTKSAINITGGISAADRYADDGSVTLGYLSLNRGHTFRDFNFSYGIFAYHGKAEKTYNSENPENSKYVELPTYSKSASALGLNTSVGYHITSSRGNTDFRIINWENSVTREFGDYLKFRKSLYGDLTYKKLIVSRNKILWTTGISSEIIFHARKNKEVKHAFKLFIGASPNLERSFDTKIKLENNNNELSETSRGNFQFTYFFALKKFNLTAQTDFSHFSSSLGLGYTF